MSDEAVGEPVEAGRPPIAAEAPEPTGDPRVDDALARLGELDGAALSEHVEVFEDIHQRLQELLTAADQDEQGPPVPRPPAPGPPGRGDVPPGSGPRP